MSLSDKSAITGVGETAFVKGTEKTAVDMMLEASRKAIADAGLKPSDIYGMVPPPIYTTSEEMAANLGIEVLRYASTVHMGGASPTTALQNAASVAGLMLTTEAMVADVPEKNAGGGMPGGGMPDMGGMGGMGGMGM